MKTEYLLALPIEPVPIEGVYPKGTSLPLHCTLMHWFCRGPRQTQVALLQKLDEIARAVPWKSIELVSDHPALFGPNRDIPVHALAEDEPLTLLHNRIFSYLAAARCDFKELRFVGAGYHPHVSESGIAAFSPGCRYHPESIVLIGRGEDGARTVIMDLPFNCSS